MDPSVEAWPVTAGYVHAEDPRLRLALEEAWKTIDLQREQLGEVKSRAIAMLSIATVAVGLFGGDAVLERDGAAGWEIAVLAGLGVLLLCAIWVSVPRPWRFGRRPDALRWYPDNAKTIDEMRAGLLADAVQDFEAHDRVLDRLRYIQFVSVAALGAIAAGLMLPTITN